MNTPSLCCPMGRLSGACSWSSAGQKRRGKGVELPQAGYCFERSKPWERTLYLPVAERRRDFGIGKREGRIVQPGMLNPPKLSRETGAVDSMVAPTWAQLSASQWAGRGWGWRWGDHAWRLVTAASEHWRGPPHSELRHLRAAGIQTSSDEEIRTQWWPYCLHGSLPFPAPRKKPQKITEVGLLLRIVSESSEPDLTFKSDPFLTSISQTNLWT